MKQFLKAIPVPTAALMLGVASLSKLLLLMNFNTISIIFACIAAVLCVILLLKACVTFSALKQELKNPVAASVAPAFPMALLVLANILRMHNVSTTVTTSIWAVASIVQVVLVIYFVKTFVLGNKQMIGQILPSWLVTFVGLAMIVITAPNMNKSVLYAIFFFAFVMALILVPIVMKRIFVIRDLPIPAKPLIAILAAPFSLCLVAYVSLFEHLYTNFVLFLLVLGQALYFIVLYELQTLAKMPFYPSFAAFTFPLVISATSLQKAQEALQLTAQWVEILLNFETIVATAFVVFVLIKYISAYSPVQLLASKQTKRV